MKMICFRCRKEIDKLDDLFEIKEKSKGKEVRTDFVHKICWNKFLEKVGSVEESMGIIRGLKKYFMKMGVLPKEEFIIK